MSKLEDLKLKARSKLGAAASEGREKLAEAILQYGFLRANWGKVSTIVVASVVVGFLFGGFVF